MSLISDAMLSLAQALVLLVRGQWDFLPAQASFGSLYAPVKRSVFRRYRQAELQNGRWAMLGVAGILAQEIVKPNVFFYSAGLPENLPNINFGGPDGKVRLRAQPKA